jgi:hypothetical protein
MGPPDRGVLERNLTAFVQSGFGQSTQAFIFMTQIEFQVKAGMESFALMLVRYGKLTARGREALVPDL